MWSGFDPEVQRKLALTKEIVARRWQTPTSEWPLVVVREHNALLVIREWPDGTITAFTMSIPDRLER
jgi:hypothetical protein